MQNNRIAQIVKPYFDWLDDVLGHLADEANRNEVNAGDIAQNFLSNARLRKIFNEEGMPLLVFYGKQKSKQKILNLRKSIGTILVIK